MSRSCARRAVYTAMSAEQKFRSHAASIKPATNRSPTTAVRVIIARNALLGSVVIAVDVGPPLRFVAGRVFRAATRHVQGAAVVLDVAVAEPHVLVGSAISESHGNEPVMPAQDNGADRCGISRTKTRTPIRKSAR